MRVLKSFKKLYKGELQKTFILTFISRSIAALGALGLIFLLGDIYGSEGVGVFALSQSVVIGSSIFSKYGMDNAVMRFVGRKEFSKEQFKYLFWAAKKAFYLSFAFAIIIFFLRVKIESFFDADGLEEVLYWFAFSTPAYTLAFILSGFFKGMRKPATASLLEGGSVALVTGVIVFILHYLMPGYGVGNIGIAFALGSWFVLAQGVVQVYLSHKKCSSEGDLTPKDDSPSKVDFMSSSLSFFLMSLAGFMQVAGTFLVAGWFLTSDELGLFKSAHQLAMTVSFVLIVINAIYPPRFSSLYFDGDYVGLESLARQGVKVGLALSAPILIVFIAIPEWVLGYMGDEFKSADKLLRVLAVAQLINVGTGSVGFLLNMTDNERIMKNIALFCSFSGIVVLLILIFFFGLMGAGLGVVYTLVIQNCLALVYVWTRLGIWILPCPNFFIWRKGF